EDQRTQVIAVAPPEVKRQVLRQVVGHLLVKPGQLLGQLGCDLKAQLLVNVHPVQLGFDGIGKRAEVNHQLLDLPTLPRLGQLSLEYLRGVADVSMQVVSDQVFVDVRGIYSRFPQRLDLVVLQLAAI